MSITTEQMEQRTEALTRGNAIRSERARVRIRIGSKGRAGASTAAYLLRSNPDFMRTMEVGELLLWVPFFGRLSARKLLEFRHISPWCPIDELEGRKRRLLAEDLDLFAAGRSRSGTARATSADSEALRVRGRRS